MNTTELTCDTCGHTTRENNTTGLTDAQHAAHEATAGTDAASWGDHHIMWPTGN
jgi:hypothetical protein